MIKIISLLLLASCMMPTLTSCDDSNKRHRSEIERSRIRAEIQAIDNEIYYLNKNIETLDNQASGNLLISIFAGAGGARSVSEDAAGNMIRAANQQSELIQRREYLNAVRKNLMLQLERMQRL